MARIKSLPKKKKIIILIIIIFIILIGVIGVIIYKKSKKELPVTKTVEVLDSIEGYDYKLEDRDTELYKEKFFQLKEVLENEEIDYDEYATLLTELYAIDLYTIDNKNNKYDVGALDFIYPEEREKFTNKLLDTMYKLVEDNSFNNRKQELPIVSDIEIIDTTNDTYQKGDSILTSYKIKVKLTYEKSLGYEENITIVSVKDDNKIYVVSSINED